MCSTLLCAQPNEWRDDGPFFNIITQFGHITSDVRYRYERNAIYGVGHIASSTDLMG